MFIKKKEQNTRHGVLLRHKSYYAWIVFGWCTLPNSTPSYNSTGNPDFPMPSCWIPKIIFI